MSLGRILCRALIRDSRIYDVNEYPDYENLFLRSVVRIETVDGVFEFLIKEDVNKKIFNKFFFFKRKTFTVELRPTSGNGDNKDLYVDKIMLTIVINLPIKLCNCLIYGLVDVYLTTIKPDGVNNPIKFK